MRTVVVGTDGSEPAEEAVRWAAEEAKARDARLVVVHAWTVPPLAYNVTSLAAIPDPHLYRRTGEEVVKRTLERRDVEALPHGVETLVARGRAQDVIVEAGADADRVVVGSRGHGPLGQFLLGSVSQAVLRTAPVPVVVVPAGQAVAA